MGKRYIRRRKEYHPMGKYITDYNANPAKYPNGYIYDEQGNLFLMREMICLMI